MDLFNTTDNSLERRVVNADSRDPATPDDRAAGGKVPSGGSSRQTARAA